MAEKKKRGRLVIAPVHVDAGWFSNVAGQPGQPIIDRTLAGLHEKAKKLAEEMDKELLFDAVGGFGLSIDGQAKVRNAIAVRRELEQIEGKVALLVSDAVVVLLKAGLSTRDAAVILGLSHQRVHQLYGAYEEQERKKP